MKLLKINLLALFSLSTHALRQGEERLGRQQHAPSGRSRNSCSARQSGPCVPFEG